MELTLGIMAAGLGQRYGGIKQIDPVHKGHILLEYSIYDALQAGFSKVALLLRRDIKNDFMQRFGKRIERGVAKNNGEVVYAYQPSIEDVKKELPYREKMWGTGHAALCLRDVVSGPFALINADDFYGRESFKVLLDFLSDPTNDQNTYAMVAFFLKNVVSPYGEVSRGICQVSHDGFLESLVEREKITLKSDGTIRYISEGREYLFDSNTPTSMSLFGFYPTLFPYLQDGFDKFQKEIIQNSDPRKEFYITTFIDGLLAEGKITMKVLQTREQWFGMTNPQDKNLVANAIQDLTNKGEYPDILWT